MRFKQLLTITILMCATGIAEAQTDWHTMRAKNGVYRRADSISKMMLTRAFAFRNSFLKPEMLKPPVSGSATAADCSYFCTSTVVAATGLELTGTRLNNKEARLDWKTVAEYNCAGFELQRSFNGGRDYFTVATAQCAGSLVHAADYRHLDQNTSPGTTWYRVKQIDTDGTFIYSNIAAVQGVKGGPGVLVYPVPARFDEVRFKLSGFLTNEMLTVIIISAQGQTVARKTIRAANGELLLSSLTKQLLSGNYILIVQTSQETMKTAFTVIN